MVGERGWGGGVAGTPPVATGNGGPAGDCDRGSAGGDGAMTLVPTQSDAELLLVHARQGGWSPGFSRTAPAKAGTPTPSPTEHYVNIE